MRHIIGRLTAQWAGRLSSTIALLTTTASLHAAEAATLASPNIASGEESGLVGFGLAALGIAGLILIRRQSSLL